MKNRQFIKNQVFLVAAGCAVNLVLFFVKLYIGLSSNSICIYADAVNNGVDCAGCIVALIGLTVLMRFVSEKYPFGPGRLQNVIDIFISVCVTLTGLYFGYNSLERLMYPTPVFYTVKYAVIVAATAGVKLLLGIFLKVMSRKTPAYTIKAMALDSFLDFFITLTTLVSFTFCRKAGYSLDGLMGIIIAVVLTVRGVIMVIETCGAVMGKKDNEKCGEARRIIEEHGLECADVNCHLYGDYAVFTATVKGDSDFVSKSKAIKESIGKEMQAEVYFCLE